MNSEMAYSVSVIVSSRWAGVFFRQNDSIVYTSFSKPRFEISYVKDKRATHCAYLFRKAEIISNKPRKETSANPL